MNQEQMERKDKFEKHYEWVINSPWYPLESYDDIVIIKVTEDDKPILDLVNTITFYLFNHSDERGLLYLIINYAIQDLEGKHDAVPFQDMLLAYILREGVDTAIKQINILQPGFATKTFRGIQI